MTKTHNHIQLDEECFYHVFNHGNDTSNIFFQERNYLYFLQKYNHYLSDYVDTYAYSLLPNHFHLLIRVKAKRDFVVRDEDYPNQQDLDNSTAGEIVSELFRRFFLSYSKSINKQQNRKGSLFQKYFRRKHVKVEHYFNVLIYYIHNQLRHHGFIGMDDKTYMWNSYGRMLIDKPSKLQKNEVLAWFGGKDAFIDFHNQAHDLTVIKDIVIENE